MLKKHWGWSQAERRVDHKVLEPQKTWPLPTLKGEGRNVGPQALRVWPPPLGSPRAWTDVTQLHSHTWGGGLPPRVPRGAGR